jgi:biopolymer transport protein ExbD
MLKRFSGESENLDTELNIVPIIDAFVMLICFLLFTGAFTQLVFLEAKLTSNTAAAADKSRSELDQFRLVITFEDNGLELATTGSAAKPLKENIPNVKGEYNFAALHERLIVLKSEYPDRFSADVEFKMKQQQAVNYDKITKMLDSVRHLTDEEFGSLRVAHKKAHKVELSGSELEKKVPEQIERLAASLSNNATSKNVDQKVLFPDVALVGLN